MAEITPMLQQYLRIKQEYPQTLVFFRLGDFYELFNDDALVASRELDIVLTSREAGKDVRMPMCGVPCHSAAQYIGKLLSRGYRVSLCEQVEDPRAAKGLVAREVVRVYTPGTVVEEGMLPSKGHNYLAAVAEEGERRALASVDLSTGEFILTEVDRADLIRDELARLAPAELLTADQAPPGAEFARTRTAAPEHFVDRSTALARLAAHYGVATPESLGLADRPAAARAAWALVSYLNQTQRGRVEHLQWPRPYQLGDFMYLDANARRNLELTRTLRDGKQEGTLLWVLDETVTPAGARTLRRWLEAPLAVKALIERRLDAVEELTRNLACREDLRTALGRTADLSRLVARLSCGSGNGRDLLALGRTLALLPEIGAIAGRFAAPALAALAEHLTPVPSLAERLCDAISPDAPATVKEGGIFRPGYHAELDELRAAAREGRGWVAALEARERERTGIRSLKVGYNQVFGYYIEVTKPNLSLVPSDYTRRQTLANAERFVCEDLKEYERRILGADERAKSLEYELFQNLRAEVVGETKRLQEIGAALGELDAFLSLAEVAVRYRYVRPRITTDAELHLTAARHPVVERCLPGGRFVPNDTHLCPDGVRVQVITGPNMSGKSTYLRQTALVVLLAHMGSFVPAEEARIGLVDRIFTRIGAADDLAGGRSTFLVEMTETAEILRGATDKSLLVLDEVGRGTGTVDGQAIARAVLEYIHDRVRARTLLGGGCYDLTGLCGDRPGMASFNVAVAREGEEIVFCHRIQPGAADRSYGIEVARLAGLPAAVLARAREIQLQMEGGGSAAAAAREACLYPIRQIGLFSAEREEVCRILAEMDLEALTPLDALNRLAELQKRLRHAHPGRSRNRSHRR